MTVAAVIVNYHTARLLDPLLSHLRRDPAVAEIVVVDNSREILPHAGRLTRDGVVYLVNDENRGFAAAVNQGVRETARPWVLLVNPDVRPLEGCVPNLLDGARSTGSPLAGPRFYWDERKVFRLPPATGMCRWLHGAGEAAARHRLDAELYGFYWSIRHDRFWKEREPFFEPFLSGALLLADRSRLGLPGGDLLDERFFLYFEDADLCVEALRKESLPVCVPQAEAVHFWDQSPGDNKEALMAASCQAFWEKHYGGLPPAQDVPARYAPAVTDLGATVEAPVFRPRRPPVSDEKYFEFALNPVFVPFAQAPFTGDSFRFPGSVWDRLAPGRYFGRIRSRIGETLEIWRWSKR